MKNEVLIKVIPVSILSLTIFLSVLIFAGSGIYVRNLGTQTQDGQLANSINVSGSGEIYATPDLLNISVSASEVRNTSSEALQAVNSKINEVVGILKAAGVPESDIQTSSLNIYPEYEYSNNNNTPRLIGQRASISVSAKVKGIDQNIERASGIIDLVSKVESIQIGNLSFGLEDDTRYIALARESAFKEAEQKAIELSMLSRVRLLRPISISDSSVNTAPMVSERGVMDMMSAGSPSTNLSSGQLLVSVSLNVIFGID